MSTSEELVQRAEAAVQNVEQAKIEIEELVEKMERVQAPAIAEAKEDIRLALIEKGQTVPANTPFSNYADKIRSITVSNGASYPSLSEDDVRYGVNYTDGSTDKVGTFTADANATSGDIIAGKTAYARGVKVVGTIGISTPSVAENDVTIPSGYIPEEQTITVGNTVNGDQIRPSTTEQTIHAGSYLLGDIVIEGSSNLKASNIRPGKSIFGVSGTFTSDATATAADIMAGKTAYVNGSKVTGTADVNGSTTSNNPSILISNDQRWRWFNIDCTEEIRTVQPYTYCANVLSINGKAFKVFGPVDYVRNEDSCEAVTDRTDIAKVYYRENDRYLFLTQDGELLGCDAVWNRGIPWPLTSITTGVSEVCPSNDGRYWVRKGDVVEYWVDYNFKTSTNSINKFISTKASGGSYNMGYTCLATKTSGELVSISSTEEYSDNIGVNTISPAPQEGAWDKVCFHGYEAWEGGGCYIFATDTNGNLYYAQNNTYELDWINSLSYTKLDGITGIKNEPGYCITEVSEAWNDETEDFYYKASVYTVALVVAGDGSLWKLIANVPEGSTSLKGVRVEQVGSDTDWRWCEPQISRNSYVLAQKGDSLVKISSSNDDNFEITVINIRVISGDIKYIYSPSSGDACAVIKPTYA